MMSIPTRTISVDYDRYGFHLMPEPNAHNDGIVVPMCYVITFEDAGGVRSIFCLAVRVASAYGFTLKQDEDGEEFADVIASRAVGAFPQILRMLPVDETGMALLDDALIDLPIPSEYILPYPPITAGD